MVAANGDGNGAVIVICGIRVVIEKSSGVSKSNIYINCKLIYFLCLISFLASASEVTTL